MKTINKRLLTSNRLHIGTNGESKVTERDITCNAASIASHTKNFIFINPNTINIGLVNINLETRG